MARLNNSRKEPAAIGTLAGSLHRQCFKHYYEQFFPLSDRPAKDTQFATDMWNFMNGRTIDANKIIDTIVRIELEHEDEIDQLTRDYNQVMADNINLHDELSALREHLEYTQKAVLQLNKEMRLSKKLIQKTNSMLKTAATNDNSSEVRAVA